MDKLKHWVKNVIEKCNPVAELVHMWPKIGSKSVHSMAGLF